MRRRRGPIETCVGGDFSRLPFVPTVAIDARDSPRFVWTALPEQPIAPVVARKAGSVFFLRRIPRILGETDRDRLLATPGFDVGPCRPVTGFASKSFLVV